MELFSVIKSTRTAILAMILMVAACSRDEADTTTATTSLITTSYGVQRQP